MDVCCPDELVGTKYNSHATFKLLQTSSVLRPNYLNSLHLFFSHEDVVLIKLIEQADMPKNVSFLNHFDQKVKEEKLDFRVKTIAQPLCGDLFLEEKLAPQGGTFMAKQSSLESAKFLMTSHWKNSRHF